MTIEQVTDENYSNFKESSRAALIVTISGCRPCKAYEPTVSTLSNQMPYIKFGKTIIDKDRSSQLKREYPDLNSWIFPTTLLFKDKKEVSKIKGVSLYPDLLSKIKNNLILESMAFVPGNNGKYIPARIKHIKDNNGLYILQLMEDSPLGKKNTSLELTKEKFLWNLESKL